MDGRVHQFAQADVAVVDLMVAEGLQEVALYVQLQEIVVDGGVDAFAEEAADMDRVQWQRQELLFARQDAGVGFHGVSP